MRIPQEIALFLLVCFTWLKTMHGRTLSALFGYGLNSDLISKIGQNGHTLAELRAISRQKLHSHYTPEEADLIKARIERVPIAEAVLEIVVAKADGACCYCSDGNNTRPYQIHHIRPYSETQDNCEDNLLVVCPNHHAAIHENNISIPSQKSTREQWHAIVDIASDFRGKGIPFPFGMFVTLDYGTPAMPKELVEFAPLSPSTTLLCFPAELANTARTRIESTKFLFVCGQSGSGKTTYATALGGLYARDGFKVFRHRFDKRQTDTLKQILLFVSTCTRKSVMILDDANSWATASELQEIAKLTSKSEQVRVIATWTNDDTEDGAKLSASDVAKQALTWPDIRPAVVEALLKYEGEVVEQLQRFERDRHVGSLGLGSLHSRLTDRIRVLGDTPKTVYEFIFGLRGDGLAVAEEFRELVQSDRSDVPMVHVAIEQIAGFERPTSIDETLAACRTAEPGTSLPTATKEWVQSVLNRQVKTRKLICVRGRYTTIHRKWAAKLIAAGLNSFDARQTTELLLQPNFQVHSTPPERLLRLWSWLRSSPESRPFVKKWEASIPQDGWSTLVRRCCQTGLMNFAFLSGKMHLLFDGNSWNKTVATAFQQNIEQIAALIHQAGPTDWYWLKEISMAMGHACAEAWKGILLEWKREAVARLLLETPPDEFDNISWTFSHTKKLCPGWLEEVGKYISWQDFAQKFARVEPGDLNSLFAIFNVFGRFGYKLKRSMLRDFTSAIKNTLVKASLDSIHIPFTDFMFTVITAFFPDEGRNVFAVVDSRQLGRALEQSIPRHWRTISELTWWANRCNSDLSRQILLNCNIECLERQIRRYGSDNKYELRLILIFMCEALDRSMRTLPSNQNEVVSGASIPINEQTRSTLVAYRNLTAELCIDYAQDLPDLQEHISEEDEQGLKTMQQQFRARDATGEDYVIEFGEPSNRSFFYDSSADPETT
jgi:energy-coupling factor transporter ATP-binding protein EcfA2